MGGIDLRRIDHMHEHPGRPNPARGWVSRQPATIHDSMEVTLMGGSSEWAYEVPGPNWMPRIEGPSGGADADYYALLPQHGAHCLVIFDHLGDAWVPAWNY